MLSPFNPPGAAPPTHDSKTWYSASWVELGRPRPRARVTGHRAHPGVGAIPPLVHLAGQGEGPCPGGHVGAIPRVTSGTNVTTMSFGSARLVAGHGTVEGDVVAERGRRLVGHGHAADVQKQGGVERVMNVVLAQIGAPGQRRRDQARAHRHARRQPETQVRYHRKTAKKISQSETLRHPFTVGANARGRRCCHRPDRLRRSASIRAVTRDDRPRDHHLPGIRSAYTCRRPPYPRAITTRNKPARILHTRS